MRKSILILGVAMALWSCKKTGSMTVTKRLASVSLLARAPHGHIMEVDTILYDNNNRVAEYRRMFFDTSFSISGFVTSISLQQENYVFSYAGSDSLPSSYVTTASAGSGPFQHFLTYNNFKQPIKDSDTYLTNSIYLSYAPNVIVAKHISTTTAPQNRTDSFILQNSNIAFRYYLFPPPTSSNSVDQITYSNLANPLYNFKGISVLLFTILQPNFDWISKNLYTNIGNSNFGNTFMAWVADADGKVISGSGATVTASLKMAFTYQ
jgi:hypothetical protein